MLFNSPGFAEHSDFLDIILDEAAEVTAQPFLEFLERDAWKVSMFLGLRRAMGGVFIPFFGLLSQKTGKEKGLWERQWIVLKALERLEPEAVEKYKILFRGHPHAEIRRWAEDRVGMAARDVIRSERGSHELVKIPAGTFRMGSPETEKDRLSGEGPMHEVRVPEFYMGRYPVTNEEYSQFLQENSDVPEPRFWGDSQFNQPRQPVVGASWNDAKLYAEWVGLRLPTEAEWEYACRSGSTSRYYAGDSEKDLDRAGWYSDNSGSKLHAVGGKEPNEFGLYDMHGNVW